MEAGFGIRLGALILDALIVALPLSVLSLLLGGGEEYFTDVLSMLYYMLVPVLWGGCTIGKRICGIRIRRVDDHAPPDFVAMLFRVLVSGIIYGITFGIAIIVSAFMVGFREDRRALHDLIAGTEVVHD